MHNFSIISVDSRTRSLSGTLPHELGELLDRARFVAAYLPVERDPLSDVPDRKTEARLIPVGDGHRADLDIAGRAVFSAQLRCEQPHRAVLAQLRRQQAEIDAGPTEPTFERLVTRLLFGGELYQSPGMHGWRTRCALADRSPRNPSGALETISITFELCAGAEPALRSAFNEDSLIRKNDARSSRNSDAEVMNSRFPSADLTLTSSVRPVARTAPRQVLQSLACPPRRTRPERAARPGVYCLLRSVGPAAGFASRILRVAASTIKTASEAT